jgi:hypothetical protein
MRANDFERFFRNRSNQLAELVAGTIGKDLVRDGDGGRPVEYELERFSKGHARRQARDDRCSRMLRASAQILRRFRFRAQKQASAPLVLHYRFGRSAATLRGTPLATARLRLRLRARAGHRGR